MAKKRQLRAEAKEQAFILEYLKDFNGSAAVIRAGYAKKSARVTASKLLAKPNILAQIEAAKASALTSVHWQLHEVLNETKLLAHSCITDYVVDDFGEVTLANGAHPDAMRAVRSLKRKVTTTKDGTISREVELTLWDKPKALDLGGSYFGAWKQTIQLPTVPLFALPVDAIPDMSGAQK